MSQPDIATTNFLELCVNKKRKIVDITEALGLDRETTDTRKELIFSKDEANDLNRRIKEYAESFKARYRNERETMLAELLKNNIFDYEVQVLGNHYGQSLWGRAGSQSAPAVFPQELSWDNGKDQNTIRYYLRCWITCYAVQAQARRNGGRVRASAATREHSESEHSDLEHPRAQQVPTGTVLPTLPFRAPEPPGMIPPAAVTRADTIAVQARLVDNEGSLGITHASDARSPITPNGKRKASSFQGQVSSGKLQRVARDARATTTSPRGRHQDLYSLPVSPSPQFPVEVSGRVVASRDQREDTCDSDRTWMPAQRQGTARSDTEIDPDEVMVDTQELFSNVQVKGGDQTLRDTRSPTIAGPSGTYQNSQRQDSVIPPSTQHGAEDIALNLTSHKVHNDFTTNTEVWRRKYTSTLDLDVSKIDPWQEKQLRMELFKLLLSYINDINQFNPAAYQPGAEDRMNALLYQFWINDADALRAKTNLRFPALEAAFTQWMDMRYSLAEFQRTTGYFGKPGEDWKEHLRRMQGVARAQASIAFVDLKSFTAEAVGETETFNDELVVVFHLLTNIEGLNGEEEFEGLRVHNEGLLEWFS